MGAYVIAMSEEYPDDYGRCPERVRKALKRLVREVLQTDPTDHEKPQIKKLSGYKNLWRLRVAKDYRAIYRVDESTRTVTLLMVGHRDGIYERTGIADADGSEVSYRIVAQAPELLAKPPSAAQVAEAELRVELEASERSDELEVALTSERLTEWNVPLEYHGRLGAVTTKTALLALEGPVPARVIEQVVKGLYPPPIEAVLNTAVRVAEDADSPDEIAEGRRSLTSFLLQLDKEQQQYVERFRGGEGKGPWAVKGGPGSGKSTVALYCVRELFDPRAQRLDFGAEPPRVLFTTYTKSLTGAATNILTALGVSERNLEVKTIDSVARTFLSRETLATKIQGSFEQVVRDLLTRNRGRYGGFEVQDARFLAAEIEWVIIGQDLLSATAYRDADRSGRGRQLGARQKDAIWTLHEDALGELARRGESLYVQLRREAFRRAEPRYDYVFIDEAQDLQPVAIRLCIRACRDPRNVFLTADNNQSVYGSGLSWVKISEELKLRGKVRILKRNYRTTRQLWSAVQPIAPDGVSGRDDETLNLVAPYRGELPEVRYYDHREAVGPDLAEWLTAAVLQEGVSLGASAVLCPSNAVADQVHSLLGEHVLVAPRVKGGFDPDAPGVKVLVIHSSKGLEFPVVAVVGLERGLMPFRTPNPADREEHIANQRRVLFVACSRASRRLAIFASRTDQSEFLELLSNELWEIEDEVEGEVELAYPPIAADDVPF